jgi:hypothetical protein
MAKALKICKKDGKEVKTGKNLTSYIIVIYYSFVSNEGQAYG